MSLHPSHPNTIPSSEAAATYSARAAAEILLHLAVRAHHNVDRADDVDYWYRLGQRNAYLQSAAQLTCLSHGAPVLEVADRLERAVEEGCVDVQELARLASTNAPRSLDQKAPELDWLGAHAFKARYAATPGTDHDYGMRWGPRSDQRISHRKIEEAPTGALYAYDATWDEYALIGLDVPTAAVEAAFRRALDSDIHMSAAEFARLVTLQIGPSADAPNAGPEL
jgi:hypothetical protein